MRALLLALWLAWATVAAGYRAPALSQRGEGSARIANRHELAVLTGAATLRSRLFEAREPQPVAVPGLPPLWLPSDAVWLALLVGPAALSARVLEARRARDGLLTARSSRGPPLGAFPIRVRNVICQHP